MVDVYQIIDIAKEHAANQMTFIGKVPKLEFFKNISKLDKHLLERVEALPDLNDDSLHMAVTELLEKENGIEVIDQTLYLQDMFPAEQVFSRRKPTEEEWKDIHFGLERAKSSGSLDIGQTVVVSNRSVMAVEAIEGTNEAIKRAKKLKQASWLMPFVSFVLKLLGLNLDLSRISTNSDFPIVVCKTSKPKQDKRFDVPTIGMKTLKAAGKNSIIAIEAGEVFFLDQEDCIDYANEHNICLVAVNLD